MDRNNCFHCGLEVAENDRILFDQKAFCCSGCKTVYEIFSTNDLTTYYDFEKSPGATPLQTKGKYEFLAHEDIVSKLLEFHEKETAIISLNIPHIHCSSCIWILENLHKLLDGIVTSQVNFGRKTVRITFNPEKTNVQEIVLLLCSVGYEPYISLEDYGAVKMGTDRSLIYKIGVAFFSFGNVMLLSFPDYFDVGEYWLDHYKGFFRWLIFLLALPSFFYAASGYYTSAYKSLKSKMYTIDIPIALGLIVMFIRSTIDMFFDYGQGFFDSLTALVFFMLLGKLFQQKTYNFLSFERDFKSYFPIAVTKIESDLTEISVPVYEVEKGDRLLIRNQELLPVDGILISEVTEIDYSFVTGEAIPIPKKSGDKLYAGGKQLGNSVVLEVLKPVSQSYLTQLWSNEVFQKKVDRKHKTITDTISHYFTPILLIIALAGFTFWIFRDVTTAFNVFTAVLIVACPCALALTAPFTLGNVLRIMGKKKLYLKNAVVIEQLAQVDTIVFDKTGTITSGQAAAIRFEGGLISAEHAVFIKNILQGSNHPLSRKLYDFLPATAHKKVTGFEELPGKGISGYIEGHNIRIGSAAYLGRKAEKGFLKTSVHCMIDATYVGAYIFETRYREGLQALFTELRNQQYIIKILSGDNEGERSLLTDLLPEHTELVFNQKPEQKLAFIAKLQEEGYNVMMIGDGLNDAGALAQSNVGISISENVNVFSPACDGILDAEQFSNIGRFLELSKKAIFTIKMSFSLSLLYNVVGLAFAVSGKLSPLVATIIMPLSTVTIVSFVTLLSNYYAKKAFRSKKKPTATDYEMAAV